MNQKQQAQGIVKAVATMEGKIQLLHDQLEKVLDDAQDRPPDGKGDGSMTSDDYTSLRQLERQVTYFLGALAGAKRV